MAVVGYCAIRIFSST